MTESGSARVVGSAAELLQDVGLNIEGVHFYLLSAEVHEVAADEDAPTPVDEIQPRYGLKIRHEGAEIGIRVSVVLELGVGVIKVDASVNYVANEVVAMTEATRLDFANNVGLMAVLPYIRQAVADLSQRVFDDVVLMPIVQRGEVSFGPDDPDELPSELLTHRP